VNKKNYIFVEKFNGMKIKLTIALSLLFNQFLSAQTNGCVVPSGLLSSNCDAIVYCYDVSGNRIRRYTPFCRTNGGVSAGGGTPDIPMREPMTNTEVSIFNAEVYPNPTASITTVELNVEVENGVLNVFDYKANIIKTLNFSGSKVDVDFSGLSAGTYIVQILSKKGNIAKNVEKVNYNNNYIK
jgi:hypothetical protein